MWKGYGNLEEKGFPPTWQDQLFKKLPLLGEVSLRVPSPAEQKFVVPQNTLLSWGKEKLKWVLSPASYFATRTCVSGVRYSVMQTGKNWEESDTEHLFFLWEESS